MPSCSLSGPITRTSRTLISRFTRNLGTIRHLLIVLVSVASYWLKVRTEQVERSRDSHAAKIRSAPATYGQSPALHFPVADHKHEWDLCLLRFSNFKPNFFIPNICLGAKPRSLELGDDLRDIGPLV